MVFDEFALVIVDFLNDLYRVLSVNYLDYTLKSAHPTLTVAPVTSASFGQILPEGKLALILPACGHTGRPYW